MLHVNFTLTKKNAMVCTGQCLELYLMNLNLHKKHWPLPLLLFIHPSKEGTYYGMALSVRPFTIACERDNLKTARHIDFPF